MKGQPRTPSARGLHAALSTARFWTAALLLAMLPGAGLAQDSGLPAGQQATPATSAAPSAAPAAASGNDAQGRDAKDKNTKAENQPRGSDLRRAAKLFLEASKLFEKEQFEEALRGYQQAAALDPGNSNYALAAELARSHAVTALIQTAAKERIRGDAAGERAALERALALDPRNIQVTEHLHEMGDDQARGQATPIYAQEAGEIGGPIELDTLAGVHSFHLHTDQKSTIQQVFKAWGLEATVDDSIHFTQVRLDVDNASFDRATQILGLLTNSFYVPLDAHRVLVARDTADNRKQFERLAMETIYLPGLAPAQLTEVGTVAKTVFDMQQAAVDPSSGTITVRAPELTLNAFNATVRDLIDGRNQVLLEVDLIQLAHSSDRNTGIRPPQSMGVFNVAAEAESVLNANQALVQQIISSGLAAPGDWAAILAILLASGQVSNPLLSNGFATFGGSLNNCTNGLASCSGALTTFGLSPGSLGANISLNSSETKELEHLQLRLGDDEDGTVRSGTRYPIQTSSYSSGLGTNLPKIPGLTGAGTSGSLSSLLGQFGSSVPNIPQIQYQDLGLTLKAKPRVMRNNDVALTVDMKIDALSGSSVNGNPILDSRSYQGVVTLKEGEGVVVVSQLDGQQSRAISGVPGLSEIPGLNNITDKDLNKNGSTLLIVMTPHVVRGTQAAGHAPMMRVEKAAAH